MCEDTSKNRDKVEAPGSSCGCRLAHLRVPYIRKYTRLRVYEYLRNLKGRQRRRHVPSHPTFDSQALRLSPSNRSPAGLSPVPCSRMFKVATLSNLDSSCDLDNSRCGGAGAKDLHIADEPIRFLSSMFVPTKASPCKNMIKPMEMA